MTRKPIFPTPPPPSLAAVTGGGSSGRGCPTCRAGGGGVNPTSMAQNDTHVAPIILTTQMWGGNYWWKKLFRAKICVPVPLAPTSVLTQNKGPDTEPHFSNPPPSLLRRASMSPPPPPQSNFQVAKLGWPIAAIVHRFRPRGNVCPARYLSIKYPDFSPRYTL